MSKDAVYGFCTRAWQPLVGCDMTLPCAKNCWARGSVARIVRCQQKQHPDRAAFFAQALRPGTDLWNGKVFLDEKHLTDPLRWRGHERVAVGYHGDWGLLSDEDRDRMMAVMARCSQHQFFTLTKRLRELTKYLLSLDLLYWGSRPLPHVFIGTSIMDQAGADAALPHMAALARAGWNTWVSYEPAIGPVNWQGWEFLKLLLMGGESGKDARPFDVAWARDIIAQCREAGCPVFFKQAGRLTIDSSYQAGVFAPEDKRSIAAARYFGMDHVGFNLVPLHDFIDPAEWEPGLRVRQLPEVPHA